MDKKVKANIWLFALFALLQVYILFKSNINLILDLGARTGFMLGLFMLASIYIAHRAYRRSKRDSTD